MTAASSLPFPSSRTLAGWWKQLSTLAPECWWVGHLLVHRVEAAVQVRQSIPLAPLPQLVLQSLDVGTGPEVSLHELEETLQLPGPLLHQYLRQLSREGLLESTPPHRWRMTGIGRQALTDRFSQTTLHQRQTFAFAERREPSGTRSLPPYFLPLASSPFVRPRPSEEGFPFNVAWLEQCIGQGAAWKEAQGFPVEVEGLLRAESRNGFDPHLPAWKKVVVDHLEEMTLLLVQGRKVSDHLLGFAVSTGDWDLDVGKPVLKRLLTSTPQLQEEVTSNACREAWLAWAKPRNLPIHDVDACELSLENSSLRVRGSHRLVESLRQTKSDLLKGDAWVLLGGGFIRQAVRLEMPDA